MKTHMRHFDGVLRDALDRQLGWIERQVSEGPWKSARFVDRKKTLRLLARVTHDRARRMSWDDASALWNAASLEAWLRAHGIV